MTKQNKCFNEYGDKMEKQILHVDVNNAFLSWTGVEMLKNGYKEDIREIVSIIGGDQSQRKGVVLAKSIKAKELGIKTGDTIYKARMIYPNIKVFTSKYSIYVKYSDMLYNLLLEYTDKIERYSIDECFLDMTNYLMNDSLLNTANKISKRIKEELGFTVNIGVANNKLLAKMASDFEKPNKVHTLWKSEIKEKLWKLPISELFMLGKKTVPKLCNMQIKTIGDLAKYNKHLIVSKFGKHGKLMWEYANGIDESEVKYIKEKPKGIGNSVTLPNDLDDIEELEKVLFSLVEQVTYRLRKWDMVAKTVNIQLRTTNFIDKTHQEKLIKATSSTKVIYERARKLLKDIYIKGTLIRLIGVRVDGLIENTEVQLSLFDSKSDERQEKIDKVLDELKNKYGYSSITRAGNMGKDFTRK